MKVFLTIIACQILWRFDRAMAFIDRETMSIYETAKKSCNWVPRIQGSGSCNSEVHELTFPWMKERGIFTYFEWAHSRRGVGISKSTVLSPVTRVKRDRG